MPILTGISLYSNLDEASGTRVDHVSAATFTDVNTVLSGTGKIGNAADFEADNSEALYTPSTAALVPGNGPFTMAIWANPETLTGIHTLVSKLSATDGEYAVVYRASSNTFRFEVFGSAGFGNFGVVEWSASVSAGNWYLALVRHDDAADTISIQVNDGTVVSAAHSAGIYAGTGSFALGGGYPGSPGFGEYYDGLLDMVGVWKRVLTTNEGTWLWNGGAGRPWAALVAEAGSVGSAAGVGMALAAGTWIKTMTVPRWPLTRPAMFRPGIAR